MKFLTLYKTKKDKASEQSGSLMIEAIALLGLMSIMSPMVVRQTSDRTTEMEDAVLAGQMKTLKDALKNYLEVNYEKITSDAGSVSWAGGTSGEIQISDILPFLPASFLTSDNKLRGNRFLDDNGYKFGYHGDCTKTLQKDGSSYAYGSGTACTSPGGATECKCMNWNLTGLVLSDNNNEIPDKRISRIAQMIGSDGGFAPTANYREGFGIDNNSVVGSQGMWQIDQVGNFGLPGAAKGGQLAAITGYAGGTQGDYLYRRKVNGVPDANSMFTDLDMGGNGQCDETSADGQCSRIHSAGGVEVVDGRLIVRQKHVDVGNWNEEEDAANEQIISLGLTNAIMAVNTSVQITAANSVSLSMDNEGASLSMSNDSVGLFMDNNAIELAHEDSNSIINLDNNGITANTSKKFTVDAGESVVVKGGTGTQLRMGNDSININSNNSIFLNTPGSIVAVMNNAIELYGNDHVNLQSSNQIGLYANNRVSIGVGNTSAFGGSGILVDANGWMNFGSSGPTYASNTAFNTVHTQIVGGLVINTQGNHALLFSQNADGIRPPVVISDTGIAMHISTDMPTGQAGYGDGKSKTDVTLTTHNNVGGRFMLAYGTPEAPQIEMRGDTGLIFASQFIPRFAVNMNTGFMDGHYSDNRGFGNTTNVQAQLTPIVQNQKFFMFDAASGSAVGVDNSNSVLTPSETFDLSINISESGYKAHGGMSDKSDASNLRFKIDPGFESVMNDIRLTSRGGARLSEILPNYIIKGIYELSNTFYQGPWPCVPNSFSGEYETDGSAHCTFTLRNPQDLDQMEKPYSCDEFSTADISGTNPTCKEIDSYKSIQINLYAADYAECNPNSEGDCDRIAHPFLGVVPAPGRGVTKTTLSGLGYPDHMGEMTGYDEGPCPDGYTPNIIFTPARFEVGKVLHAVSRYDYSEPMTVDDVEVGEEAWIAKNYDKNRWTRDDVPVSGDYATSTEGLFQPSTQMEYATKAIKKSDGTILGWQVAMGNYSQVGEDFVWNYGATTRIGDMFGYATTYCTFNPQRYRMPNMKWLKSDDKSGKVIAPMRGVGDKDDN